jgi:hypothetical protein
MAVAHVVLRRTHHAGVATVSITTVSHGVTTWWTLLHGGERASETSGTTLEVGEATRRAVPITGTGAVLARWERNDDVGSAVNDAAGGGRNLNGLLIQRTAIHTERLCGLFVRGEDGKAGSGWLMLVGSAESPEGDGTSTKLGKPALKL